MAEEIGGTEEWLTVPALRKRLGWPWSEDTIGRMIQSGELPGVQRRKGATRYVKLSDATAFAANGFRRVSPAQDASEAITPSSPATRS